ncbi:hypothetical protein ACJX0J_019916, partial [Zea mays]
SHGRYDMINQLGIIANRFECGRYELIGMKFGFGRLEGATAIHIKTSLVVKFDILGIIANRFPGMWEIRKDFDLLECDIQFLSLLLFCALISAHMALQVPGGVNGMCSENGCHRRSHML